MFRNVMPPSFRRQGTAEANGRAPACLDERVKIRGASAFWGKKWLRPLFLLRFFSLTSLRPIGYNRINGLDGKSTAPEAQSELRVVQGSRGTGGNMAPELRG